MSGAAIGYAKQLLRRLLSMAYRLKIGLQIKNHYDEKNSIGIIGALNGSIG
jgi:hypothetical protein